MSRPDQNRNDDDRRIRTATSASQHDVPFLFNKALQIKFDVRILLLAGLPSPVRFFFAPSSAAVH